MAQPAVHELPVVSFGKRLLSGTALLTASNGAVRLLTAVTMPVLTRLLSPQAYGVAALVGTLVSLASVLALAGIDVSYARAYHSQNQPNGLAVEQYCWRFAISTALLMCISAAAAWMLWGGTCNRSLNSSIAILLAMGVFLSVVHAMAQMRARLAARYRVMALATLLNGIVTSAAGIAIAYWWRQDALALLIPLVLGYFVPLLLLGTPSVNVLREKSRVPRADGLALVKIGLPAIVTAPMYWFLSSSDRWFLQHYSGEGAVGIYSIAYSVGIIGMMVNTAVMSLWLPEAAREYERNRQQAHGTLGRLMSRLIAVMMIVWLMVTAAGGDIIRFLANERFHDAAQYVPFIAGGTFFYGTSHMALSGLILVKRFKLGALWWIVGGLVCLGANVLLVPTYGGGGAAVTQTVSFAVIALGLFYSSQTVFHVRMQWRQLAELAFLTIVAGALMATSWHSVALVSLLMKLPIGIVIALISLLVIAPDWCIRGMRAVRKALFKSQRD